MHMRSLSDRNYIIQLGYMPTCSIQQLFGQNANTSYATSGLRGHPAVDTRCGFGTDVLAKYSGIAYKVLTKNNPSNDGSGFTGVFQIVDDGIECFEWLTGHLDPTISQLTELQKGDKIGTEANNGTVFSGGIQITLAMQKAGDQRGSHRHYQKRAIMPVKRTSWGKQYLTAQGTGSPYWHDGHYYEIIGYSNGFNACINPLQPVFDRTLTLGSSGYDCFVLQRILARNGYLADEPTGYFGVLTASALTKWQASNGISPFPIFGPKSRQLALRELQPLPTFSGI